MKPSVTFTDFTSIAMVALGSNLGTTAETPGETIRSALDALNVHGFAIREVSRFYASPAFPAGSGPDFVNAAAAFETAWPAEQVLAHLHSIEAQYGRARTVRWAPRSLDLDLIAIGDNVLPNRETVEHWMSLPIELQAQATPKELLLPHPRLHERAFVLLPLVDIAATWQHPVLGQDAATMLAKLPKYLTDDVTPFAPA
ncbi:MAG: 2-amino-4-hydroxy-6-hydroxymethyldihydropteridine diphosphokinase [Pseudomonadota bacterium]